MADWSDLERELTLWREAGETPTLWWRDDDTHAPTGPLDRLLATSERYAIPIHLAVIPADIAPDLADRLAGAQGVYVMQHGFAHINHEPKGVGASEIGDHRRMDLQLSDLREGARRLADAALPNTLPALAPPWNRVSDATLPHLAGLDFRLLSQFDARRTAQPARGLMQVNCHIDPIHWKQGARYRGLEPTLDSVVTHLANRRTGRADRAEPTGLLTHHLQSDAGTWAFVDALLDRLSRHDHVRWVSLSSLLDPL